MYIIRKIFIHISIALAVTFFGWTSHFYRFPQHEIPIVTLGSGIILGVLFRIGAKALPSLFVGLIAAYFQLKGYTLLASFWLSSRAWTLIQLDSVRLTFPGSQLLIHSFVPT